MSAMPPSGSSSPWSTYRGSRICLTRASSSLLPSSELRPWDLPPRTRPLRFSASDAPCGLFLCAHASSLLRISHQLPARFHLPIVSSLCPSSSGRARCPTHPPLTHKKSSHPHLACTIVKSRRAPPVCSDRRLPALLLSRQARLRQQALDTFPFRFPTAIVSGCCHPPALADDRPLLSSPRRSRGAPPLSVFIFSRLRYILPTFFHPFISPPLALFCGTLFRPPLAFPRDASRHRTSFGWLARCSFSAHARFSGEGVFALSRFSTRFPPSVDLLGAAPRRRLVPTPAPLFPARLPFGSRRKASFCRPCDSAVRPAASRCVVVLPPPSLILRPAHPVRDPPR